MIRTSTLSRSVTALCAVALSSALLGACGGGHASLGGGSTNAVLSVAPQAAPAGPFTRNFNPFSTQENNAVGNANYLIYEPLLMDNYATHKISPWLVSSYTWGDGGKSLTLNLRAGVKWSDGKPFDAQDVAFTIGLMKKYPAMNTGGIPFAGAQASGSSKVIVTFTGAAYVYLSAIAKVTPLPEHIWTKVANPSTFANPDPVGTGPYLLSSFTSQVIALKKNSHYWQPGKPAIPEVRYLAFDSQGGELAALETGKVQWASLKLSSGVAPFVNRDKAHNKVLAIDGVDNILELNVDSYPLGLLVVRKAISDAIDRQSISTISQHGVNPPATSPTGLDPTTQRSLMEPSLQSLRYGPADPAKARSELLAAGFKVGAGGVLDTPKGSPFTLSLPVPASSEGFLNAAEIIKADLAKAGISVNIQTASRATVQNDQRQGHFQAMFFVAGADAVQDPYFLYQGLMDYSLSAPIGKQARSDLGRFHDAQDSTLLNDYTSSSPGSSAHRTALYGLEKAMVTQVPGVPDFQTAFRAEFSTNHFGGWPSKSNLYAPAEAYWRTVEPVVLHLKPVGK